MQKTTLFYMGSFFVYCHHISAIAVGMGPNISNIPHVRVGTSSLLVDLGHAFIKVRAPICYL